MNEFERAEALRELAKLARKRPKLIAKVEEACEALEALDARAVAITATLFGPAAAVLHAPVPTDALTPYASAWDNDAVADPATVEPEARR